SAGHGRSRPGTVRISVRHVAIRGARRRAAAAGSKSVVPRPYGGALGWKIELIPVPVTDVDRAKGFYEKVGFNADHDYKVRDGLRFVQLTPPGSACSIVIGEGITEKAPGTQEIQVVVADAETARKQLLA